LTAECELGAQGRGKVYTQHSRKEREEGVALPRGFILMEALQLLVLIDQLPLRLSEATEPQSAFLTSVSLESLIRRLEPGTLCVKDGVLEVVLFPGGASSGDCNYEALAAEIASKASYDLPELLRALHAATVAAVLRECPFVPPAFAAFPTPLLYTEDVYGPEYPPEDGVNAATGQTGRNECSIFFPNPAFFREAHHALLMPRVPPFWRTPPLLQARNALQLLADYPHEMVHALQSFPDLYQKADEASIMLAEHDPSAVALNLLWVVLGSTPLSPLLAAPGLFETVFLYQVREALCTMGAKSSPDMVGFEDRYQAWRQSCGKVPLVPVGSGRAAGEGDDVDTAKIRLSVESFPRPLGAQLGACFAAGRRGDLALVPCPSSEVGTVRSIHEVNKRCTEEKVLALNQRLREAGVPFFGEE
jgi:hypothetical protein